jgi:Uma2 family endonuclease
METPDTMEKTITCLSQLDMEGVYSYADYLLWQFEERVELYKGKISPLPSGYSPRHQKVLGALMVNIFLHLKKSPCECFAVPFDVRLPDKANASRADKDVYTVVQPDLVVICDKNNTDERGGIGAPDLVVEILSPSSSKKELKIKYALYEESGVREYWVVFPSEYVLEQFVLSDAGRYELKGIFAEDEVFSAHIFPELQVDLAEVFAE